MKTFISDIIPKIQKYSQRLDNLTLLTNQQWVVIDEIDNAKTVYIFRQNNELLISKNGKVEKAKWEYLGNNLLLIDHKDESYLFKHGFFDENILALKIDGKDEYAFLVNETKYNIELNSIDRIIEFLQMKYISNEVFHQIGISSNNLNKVNDSNIVEIEGVLVISKVSKSTLIEGDYEVLNCLYKGKEIIANYRIHLKKYYHKARNVRSVYFNTLKQCLDDILS